MKLTLLGPLFQKGNSRRIVGKRVIKSQNALDCVASFRLQAQAQWKGKPLEGRIAITTTVFYRTRASDLCTSLLKDLLEGICYLNDRQIFEEHNYKEHDKNNPRVEVEVKEI